MLKILTNSLLKHYDFVSIPDKGLENIVQNKYENIAYSTEFEVFETNEIVKEVLLLLL